jgi:hypothetical protein
VPVWLLLASYRLVGASTGDGPKTIFRAQLLDGARWERAKGPALTDLQLSEGPDALLAEQSRALDAALRDLAVQVSAGTVDATVDAEGRLHLPKLSAIPEPPSLADLRKRVSAMPRVDLPEVILEVMAWVPEFTSAFTLASGARPGWMTCTCQWPRA